MINSLSEQAIPEILPICDTLCTIGRDTAMSEKQQSAITVFLL